VIEMQDGAASTINNSQYYSDSSDDEHHSTPITTNTKTTTKSTSNKTPDGAPHVGEFPPGVETPPSIFPGPSVLNWRKFIPNSITAMATTVGLSGVMFALEGRYEMAVASVLIAGLLDGLDGPAARALNGTSRFGAEFDSLSDYVNFGVTPSLLLYFWSFHRWGWYGWSASVFYTVCMGCRLARFNAGVDFNALKHTRAFFMGVPAPAGAMLVMLPLMCAFYFTRAAAGDSSHLIQLFTEGLFRESQLIPDICQPSKPPSFLFSRSTSFLPSLLAKYQFISFDDPRLTIPFTIFVGFMLISRVPTFSSKMINKKTFMGGQLAIVKKAILGIFISMFVVGLFSTPWLVMVSFAFLYVISFPLSYSLFLVLAKREKKNKGKTQ